jgi:hypothetical protein
MISCSVSPTIRGRSVTIQRWDKGKDKEIASCSVPIRGEAACGEGGHLGGAMDRHPAGCALQSSLLRREAACRGLPPAELPSPWRPCAAAFLQRSSPMAISATSPPLLRCACLCGPDLKKGREGDATVGSSPGLRRRAKPFRRPDSSPRLLHLLRMAGRNTAVTAGLLLPCRRHLLVLPVCLPLLDSV